MVYSSSGAWLWLAGDSVRRRVAVQRRGVREREVEAREDRVAARDRADAEQVRAHLTTLRAANGREAAVPYAAAEIHLRGARRRVLAGDDPRIVFEDLLQLAADNSERDIAFWSTRVLDLEDIKFPAKLLRSRHLTVGIMVVHPPAHGAVPDYLVLFAMAEPDQSD